MEAVRVKVSLMKNLTSRPRESENLNFIAYKDALTYARAKAKAKAKELEPETEEGDWVAGRMEWRSKRDFHRLSQTVSDKCACVIYAQGRRSLQMGAKVNGSCITTTN